jgi:sugar lactone lactonase YvrE
MAFWAAAVLAGCAIGGGRTGLLPNPGQGAYPLDGLHPSVAQAAVLVADFANSEIKGFPSGCLALGCVVSLGTGFGFDNPRGVAVDAHGTIYVADTGNNRLERITPGCVRSSCVATLVSRQTFKGFSPSGVAVDAHGYVYVADSGNDKVEVFACNGPCKGRTLGGSFPFGTPLGVAVDRSGTVYVADQTYKNGAVFEIKPRCTASCVTQLGGAATFAQPGGVAVDAKLNVYVADTDNKTVQAMTPNCVSSKPSPACVATLGGGSALFSNQPPQGVAVDALGDVYVTVKADPSAVYFMTPNCRKVACVTKRGAGFGNPVGVAVGPANALPTPVPCSAYKPYTGTLGSNPGIPVAIYNNSGLPTSAIYVWVTGSTQGAINDGYFLTPLGALTQFSSTNEAPAMPLQCFPGSIVKTPTGKPGKNALVVPAFQSAGELWIAFGSGLTFGGTGVGSYTTPSGWVRGDASAGVPYDHVEFAVNPTPDAQSPTPLPQFTYVDTTAVNMLGLPLSVYVPGGKGGPANGALPEIGVKLADGTYNLMLTKLGPWRSLVRPIRYGKVTVSRIVSAENPIVPLPKIFNNGTFMQGVLKYYSTTKNIVFYSPGANPQRKYTACSDGKSTFYFAPAGETCSSTAAALDPTLPAMYPDSKR